MKKLCTLILSLMLLFSLAAAEEMNHYLLSPEDITAEGSYMLLEEYGLILFIPADFVSYEVSEEDMTSKGVKAILGREDGSLMLTISFAGIADAEGNIITTYEDLIAHHAASGLSVEHCAVNYLETMFYTAPAELLPDGVISSGLCIQSSIEGAWLNIVAVAASEADMEMGSLILFSCMPQAAE